MFYTTSYCLLGELLEFLNNHKSLTHHVKLAIITKLLHPIISLYQKNLCHGDLKLENLLIRRDFEFSLCDLGTMTLMGEKGIKTVFSENYGAPEIKWNHRLVSKEKSEVYSLGVMFHVIMYGKFPNSEISGIQGIDKLMRNMLKRDWKEWMGFEEL